MSGPRNPTRRVLYRERQRFPWFGAIYGATAAECVAVIGIGAALLAGHSFREIDSVILGGTAAFGALIGLQTGRRVWLFPEALRIGWQLYPGGPEVPLDSVGCHGRPVRAGAVARATPD